MVKEVERIAKLQKVRKEGASRVIAVTKFLPDWLLVRVTTVKKNETSVTVRFDKVA